MAPRILLIITATLSLALFATSSGTAASAPPSPEPFGKYLVYSAAGVFDEAIPPAEGDLAEWFHRDIMGRDSSEVETERAAADAYFTETFGAAYTPGSLFAFGLDPRNEYRVYFISGMKVPAEGWVVRDGGFMAILDDGSMVVYGDYNIKVTRPGAGSPDPEPLIIHYESLDPIHSHADDSIYFRCVLSSDAFEDFGGGLAQGVSAPHTLPDGRTVANIRNVLTFPGLGFAAQP